MSEISFGQSDLPWEGIFPRLEDLALLPNPPKLTKIYYKICDNDYNLAGIQLVFTNGFKSPMF